MLPLSDAGENEISSRKLRNFMVDFNRPTQIFETAGKLPKLPFARDAGAMRAEHIYDTATLFCAYLRHAGSVVAQPFIPVRNQERLQSQCQLERQNLRPAKSIAAHLET